jgi:hypothetical protein
VPIVRGRASTSCGGIFKKSLRCSSKMASRDKRRERMKITSIVVIVSLAVVPPAFGQQMSPADQEMTKVRQAITN